MTTAELTHTEPYMTTPPHPGQPGVITCVHVDPWWKGVGGMDPELPVADWHFAAEIAVTALAARFLDLEARGNRVFNARSRGYEIAAEWLAWLEDSGSETTFFFRRLALWRACEREDTEQSGILRVAQDLHRVLRGGRR